LSYELFNIIVITNCKYKTVSQWVKACNPSFVNSCNNCFLAQPAVGNAQLLLTHIESDYIPCLLSRIHCILHDFLLLIGMKRLGYLQLLTKSSMLILYYLWHTMGFNYQMRIS